VTEITWRPGWRQLALPSLIHGVAVTGALLSTLWQPWASWLTLPIVVSWTIEVRRTWRAIGMPVRFRIEGGRIAVDDGARWRDIAADQSWLGPSLIVLQTGAGRRWLYAAELSSRDDAHLRRTIRLRRSTGDRL
jgi:hypothetical protein